VVQVLCDSVAREGRKNHSTMTSKKRRRHTPDQIIRKLAEGHKQLAAGKDLDEVCRHLEIAESTWHRWLAQYGGMKANDAKRLKELEAENARLKKLVANQALDIDMLKEISRRETSDPEPQAQRRHDAARTVRGLRTPSLQGRRHPPLDPAARPATSHRRGGRAACVPARVLHATARGGGGDVREDGPPAGPPGERQADPTAVARRRPAGPSEARKKRLTGIGVHVGAMCPIRPNVLWAMDFQFDTTADGRTIKMLNVIDEFTRECLAIEVDRSIDADHVVAVLDRLALERGGPPVYVRMDNGPELVASRHRGLVPVQRHRQRVHRSRLAVAERVDRVVQRPLRDELLNGWQFDSLLEARVIIEDWRIDYNWNRPHTAHGDLTPSEFAAKWTTINQPQAA
jgi:putative transposase